MQRMKERWERRRRSFESPKWSKERPFAYLFLMVNRLFFRFPSFSFCDECVGKWMNVHTLYASRANASSGTVDK